MGMTPELQRYYEKRLAMMGDEAWKDLMEDVQRMLDATNMVENVKDGDDLKFKKGEISMMRWMLSLKQVSEDSYEQLKAEDAEIA